MNELKPAIIVVAHNRENSLINLLNCIASSSYIFDNIQLVISIDFSNQHEKIAEIANSFEWGYGQKRIIRHSYNLGLKNHIIFCGDLLREFDSVIILEDDLLVSKEFYNYSYRAINFYKDSNGIAGISLFNHCYNEIAKLPFFPTEDGTDGYFMKIASSWGQIWSQPQWYQFKKWLKKNNWEKNKHIIPEAIQDWPDTSWKKLFILYLESNDLYFFYPRKSFTINTSAPGVHHKINGHHLNPEIAQDSKQFRFPELSSSTVKYDSFCELDKSVTNHFIDESLDDLEFNLYGFKYKKSKYQICPTAIIGRNKSLRTFGKVFHPHEINIRYSARGHDFCLIDYKYPLKKRIKRDFNFYYKINPNYFPPYFNHHFFIIIKKILVRLRSKIVNK